MQTPSVSKGDWNLLNEAGGDCWCSLLAVFYPLGFFLPSITRLWLSPLRNKADIAWVSCCTSLRVSTAVHHYLHVSHCTSLYHMRLLLYILTFVSCSVLYIIHLYIITCVFCCVVIFAWFVWSMCVWVRVHAYVYVCVSMSDRRQRENVWNLNFYSH